MKRFLLFTFSCLSMLLFTQCTTQITFDKEMAKADALSRYSEYEYFLITAKPLSPHTTITTLCDNSTVSPKSESWMVVIETQPEINTTSRELIYVFYDTKSGKRTEVRMMGTLKKPDIETEPFGPSK